ncbi:MAG TPA: hypothetical protein VFM51_05280 [Solirubrobacterales bacterium]|nr:hypothetical protein [Solirubrobacterales bacterium]
MNAGGDTGELDSNAVWKAALLVLCVAVVLFGTVAAVVIAANDLQHGQTLRPEIVLPLIVIVGVVALLMTLAVAAAMFGIFNMSDRGQALGLPAGSVQAVIALGLILIFAVVALYASSASGTEEFESTNLTQEEFEAIPATEIVQVSRTKSEGEVTYSVVRSIEDRDLKDINLQLLTTVSTLVVAVAAFYFGSKSVQEGSKAVTEAAAPKRTLNVTSPPSPHEWTGPASPLPIDVQSLPPNAQLRWFVVGDDGQLQNVGDGKFEYTPGGLYDEGGSVTLKFEQVDDAAVNATLVVNFEGSQEQPATAEAPPEQQPPAAEVQ